MTNGRQKGKVGELELAAFLRDNGIGARRGQQYAGGGDSPDIVAPELGAFHIECKRKESGNLYDWLAQAKKDAAAGKVPIVMHRKNKKQWVAILDLQAFLDLLLFTGVPTK